MIRLNHIALRRGAKGLLDDVSLVINPGEKVGLVGRNGAGKSSLFALLLGELHEDSGDFEMPPTWRLAQVAQHMPETNEPATQFVLAGDTRLAEIEAKLRKAEAAGDGMAVGDCHAQLADAGGHDANARAQALILGLGFRPDELERPVNSFSGGWRMRLQLARALMCPADLLLLDEPTNHLDLDALVWLESWLQRFAGTVLVISHDREFLDAVTDTTVHIEQQRATRYGGNYTAFETLRAQQMELQQSAYVKQQDRIAHLQRFIDRFKAKATKARQAQSRVKALERMERLAPVLTAADFQFEFPPPPSLPNPMLVLRDVACGYGVDESARRILEHVNCTVLAGQRIGILGANGQGKSTLVKTVARQLSTLGGALTEGKGLRIGYFAQQELDILRSDESPMGHMLRLARETGASAEASREQPLRDFLGGFQFTGDMVGQAVGTMSGGEKARLVLAMLVWQKPNLLLLDEPTNHLDLITREALSMALNEFEGTVLLVSHDRALLRAVCDEFWLVARGGLSTFDGDLDDYQRHLQDEARRVREALATVQSGEREVGPSAAEQRRQQAAQRQALAAQLRPLRKELAGLDQHLAQLTSERADLEARLMQPLAPDEFASVGRRLKAVGDALNQAEERWLEVSELIEAAVA